MAILQDQSADLAALLAKLQAENAALKAAATQSVVDRLRIKMGPDKGWGKNRTVHVTGINGKYGVALYPEQVKAYLELKEDLLEFIDTNAEALANGKV